MKRVFLLLVFLAVCCSTTADAAEHICHLTIPANMMPTGPDGFISFDDAKFTNVSPGDRVTFDINFSEGAIIYGEPSYTELKIRGLYDECCVGMATSEDPYVETQGTHKLKWRSGGLYTDQTEGKIVGFWVYLTAFSSPLDQQTVLSVRASFVIPDKVLDIPILENQQIEVSMISWENLWKNTSVSDSIPGDITGDGLITLADAIIGMQIVSHFDLTTDIRPDYTTAGVDINHDHKLSSEEIIYILQSVCGMREMLMRTGS
ncbi:MAG: hypothetical protein GXP53_12995 [Deltaproteobacteria bacterium]|nr:hypothetical protein [Deltaproteobacteria bacterium]